MADASLVRLAVNGTLMRGLALHNNMLMAGADFVADARTAPIYRLYSIGDIHPAMQRVDTGGVSVAVELYDIPAAGLAAILLKEPPGLCIGKVTLDDGQIVLGVLGEAILCANGKDITPFGGWREYMRSVSGM